MSDAFKRIEVEETDNPFKDEGIFSTDYEPQSLDEVLHRDEQQDEIVRAIRKTIKEDARAELYVYGVSGNGKTFTVKAVLKFAPKEWAEKFQYAWVNCRTTQPLGEYQIYKEILIQLGYRFGKGRGRGFSRRDLKDLVIKRHKEKPLLVVLDEVDILARKGEFDIIYTFMNVAISLILISNVYGWEDEADARIKSRAKTDRVDFPAYKEEELSNILHFIVNKGLEEDVMSGQILEKITKETIEKFSGDVRKGKFLISSCVFQAMDRGAKIITDEHLKKAFEKVKPMSLKEILANFALPDQVALAGFVAQKLNVNDGIHGKGRPATTKNIHHFYEICAKLNGLEPVEWPMMKDYLGRLEVGGIINHETTSHPSRGRTNIYYSNYDVNDLEWALKELGIKLPSKGGIGDFFGG